MAWPYTGKDGLIENVYLKLYRQKSGEDLEVYLKGLFNGRISAMAFLSAYRYFPPIEQMAEEDKNEMKLYVNNLIPDKTIEEKIAACKILYTIGELIIKSETHDKITQG